MPLKVLSEADSVIVLGYSFPRSDEFFRHLYAIGSIGTTFVRRFWVFDINPEVEDRFRPVLGEQARDRFQFYPLAFEEQGLRKLAQNLGVGVLP